MKNTKQKSMSFWKKLTLFPILILATILVVGGIGFSSRRVASADDVIQVVLDSNGGLIDMSTAKPNYNSVGKTLLHISSDAELASFRDSVNSGETFASYVVVLDSDVNFSGAPIGSLQNGTPFKGIFDGQNHTITVNGMTLSGADDGLFGYVESTEAFDIGIYNTNVYYQTVPTGNTYNFGGLAGKTVGTAAYMVQIKNCSVSASEQIYLKGTTNFGGLIGETSDTNIENSFNTASIYGDRNNDYEGDINIGGLLGRMKGVNITNCYNTGNVSGTTKNVKYRGKVGGLVGREGSTNDNDYKQNVIKYCYNTGSLYGYHNANSATNYIHVGGLFGEVDNGKLVLTSNCFNNGSRKAERKNLIGQTKNADTYEFGNGSPSITNCYSNLDLTDSSYFTNASNWSESAWNFENVWGDGLALKVYSEQRWGYPTTLSSIKSTKLTYKASEAYTIALENFYENPGYEFLGWTDEFGWLDSNEGILTDEEISDVFDLTGAYKNFWFSYESFNATESTTFYAVWRANKYPLYFNFKYEGSSSTFCVDSDMVYYQTDYRYIAKDIIKNRLNISDLTSSNVLEGYYTETPIIEGFMDFDISEDETQNKMEVTVIYKKKSFDLTANYILLDENGEVDEEATAKLETKSQTIQVVYGQIGSIVSPEITGYTIADNNLTTVEEYMHSTNEKLVKTATETLTDYVEEGGITVDVYYTINKYNLNINYFNSENGMLKGVTYSNYSSEVYYSRPYSVDSLVFEGQYNLVDSTQSVISGNMPAEDLTINVYYAPCRYNVTVNYVFEDGTTAFEQRVETYDFYYAFNIDNPTIFGYDTQDIVTGTIGTEDREFTVTYNPKLYKYNIYYKSLSGLTLNDTVSSRVYYNDNVTCDAVEIEGYTPSILGDINLTVNRDSDWWVGDPEDEDNDDSTCVFDVYVVYAPINYEIVYKFVDFENGEITEFTDEDERFVRVYNIENETIFLDMEILKPGYTFYGWYSDETCEEQQESIMQGTIGSVTLYAYYTINSYSIKFYVETLNNGFIEDEERTLQNEINFTVESETILLKELSKTGYAFSGWFLNEDYTNEIESVANGTYSDIVVYGKLTIIEYSISYFEIGFNEEDKTIVTDEIEAVEGLKTSYTVLDFEDDKLILQTRERFGYEFSGWFTEVSCENSISEIGELNIGDKVLYSYFRLGTFDINIEFREKTEDGILVEERLGFEQVLFNDNFEISLAEIEIDGYTFDNTQLISGIMDTEGKTFVVILNPKTYEIVINFIKADGTVMHIAVTEECEFNADFEFDYSEFAIDGYSADLIVSGTLETEGTEINVVYNLIEYTLTYYVDGEVFDDLTFTIESDTILLEELSKTGFSFSGWYLNDDYTNEVSSIENGTYSDIAVYGKFTVIDYTITYYIDETLNETISLKSFNIYDLEEDVLLVQPTRTGYTFFGWREQEDLSGDEITAITECRDYVLYSRFDINSYNVEINYSYSNDKHQSSQDIENVVYGEEYNFSVSDVTGYKYVIKNSKNEVVDAVSGVIDENGAVFNVEYIPNSYLLKINISFSNNAYDVEVKDIYVDFDDDFTYSLASVTGYRSYVDEVEQTSISGTMDSINGKLYDVIYEPVSVKVVVSYVYDVSGIKADDDIEEEFAFDSDYSIDTPTILGYTADKTVVTGTVSQEEQIDITVTFTANSYNIHVINYNNEEISIINVKFDNAVSIPVADYVRKGYTFKGYSTNENGIVDIEADDGFIYKYADDLTVYEVWEKNPSSSNIIWIILPIIIVLVLAGLGIGLYFILKNKKKA